MKVDPQRIMTKAQIHLSSENLNKQDFIAFSDNDLLSQKRNLDLETQILRNENFRSHDDREIVMANDEAFGALDFQHDDTNFDATDFSTKISNSTSTQHTKPRHSSA